MIAFYAPLKAPDHPVASGDRRMAQLLFSALQQAGFKPRIESTLRAYEPTGQKEAQAALEEAAASEVACLLERYREEPALRPRLWFTYHCYYKAVDHIGPAVAGALGIPYCVAEASRAPRQAHGRLARAHALSEAALDTAKVIFVITAKDRPALERAKPEGQKLIDLPPFVAHVEPFYQPRAMSDKVELLTVAMMRPDVKRESYYQLAQSLANVDRSWHLTIVGDGEVRAEIEALFAPFKEKVTFLGLVADAEALASLYARSDLLVWPAVNEAYGMVFLEAAAQGCPALAGMHGGVASVVLNGRTGVLVTPDDTSAFASMLIDLIDTPEHRQALGRQAQSFVRENRSLEHAASVLRHALLPLTEPGRL